MDEIMWAAFLRSQLEINQQAIAALESKIKSLKSDTTLPDKARNFFRETGNNDLLYEDLTPLYGQQKVLTKLLEPYETISNIG